MEIHEWAYWAQQTALPEQYWVALWVGLGPSEAIDIEHLPHYDAVARFGGPNVAQYRGIRSLIRSAIKTGEVKAEPSDSQPEVLVRRDDVFAFLQKRGYPPPAQLDPAWHTAEAALVDHDSAPLWKLVMVSANRDWRRVREKSWDEFYAAQADGAAHALSIDAAFDAASGVVLDFSRLTAADIAAYDRVLALAVSAIEAGELQPLDDGGLASLRSGRSRYEQLPIRSRDFWAWARKKTTLYVPEAWRREDIAPSAGPTEVPAAQALPKSTEGRITGQKAVAEYVGKALRIPAPPEATIRRWLQGVPSEERNGKRSYLISDLAKVIEDHRE